MQSSLTPFCSQSFLVVMSDFVFLFAGVCTISQLRWLQQRLSILPVPQTPQQYVRKHFLRSVAMIFCHFNYYLSFWFCKGGFLFLRPEIYFIRKCRHECLDKTHANTHVSHTFLHYCSGDKPQGDNRGTVSIGSLACGQTSCVIIAINILILTLTW